MEIILPNITDTRNVDDLEAEVKRRLHDLDPIDQLAEMETIQANYNITAEAYPSWTDEQTKRDVYQAWISKREV